VEKCDRSKPPPPGARGSISPGVRSGRVGKLMSSRSPLEGFTTTGSGKVIPSGSMRTAAFISVSVHPMVAGSTGVRMTVRPAALAGKVKVRMSPEGRGTSTEPPPEGT
jgi:hypothetical protein